MLLGRKEGQVGRSGLVLWCNSLNCKYNPISTSVILDLLADTRHRAEHVGHVGHPGDDDDDE